MTVKDFDNDENAQGYLLEAQAFEESGGGTKYHYDALKDKWLAKDKDVTEYKKGNLTEAHRGIYNQEKSYNDAKRRSEGLEPYNTLNGLPPKNEGSKDKRADYQLIDFMDEYSKDFDYQLSGTGRRTKESKSLEKRLREEIRKVDPTNEILSLKGLAFGYAVQDELAN